MLDDRASQFDFFDKNKTAKFKFQKPAKGQTRSNGDTLQKTLKASLGTNVTFAEAVKCPPGEDLNEWLAMNSKARERMRFQKTTNGAGQRAV